jgi:hypothetical protein
LWDTFLLHALCPVHGSRPMVMPSLSITPMGLGALQGEAFSSMLEWGEHVFEVW